MSATHGWYPIFLRLEYSTWIKYTDLSPNSYLQVKGGTSVFEEFNKRGPKLEFDICFGVEGRINVQNKTCGIRNLRTTFYFNYKHN